MQLEFFLFNDMLLYARDQQIDAKNKKKVLERPFLVYRQIHRSLVSFKEKPDFGKKCNESNLIELELISRDGASNSTFKLLLAAASLPDKRRWLDALQPAKV